MARKGSKRQAPKQEKQPKNLSKLEEFKKAGGLKSIGMKITRAGFHNLWNKSRFFKKEEALDKIAEATGLERGTQEFDDYMASIALTERQGGDPDRVFLNNYMALEREFGKYGTSALRERLTSENKKIRQRTKNKRMKEYIQLKAFWQYTSSRWIGLSIDERADKIKEQFKVNTLSEAFQEFKNSMDIDTFADAVMSVDESMLKAFGLNDDKIEEIRNMGETDRYHFIKEQIALGPDAIKLLP